jgi:hypothetical protein
MKSSFISALAILASIDSAYAQTATSNVNNPAGAAYLAGIGADNPYGSVKGGIIVTNAEGEGTQFSINFWDLPAEGGPFCGLNNSFTIFANGNKVYHIHTGTVPDNGNCTATGGHLDPFNRGETPACDSTNPASCQVGDLSGKYGQMTNGTVFSAR